jgi:hypothetical protein
VERSGYVPVLLLVLLASGCQKPDMVSAGLEQLVIPKCSVVQYAEASRGTQFIPGQGMGITNTVLFPSAGYVLFIDEEPKCDWAHSFQLVFLPKASGKPDVLFRGSALPDFEFKTPDGSTIMNWKKR